GHLRRRRRRPVTLVLSRLTYADRAETATTLDGMEVAGRIAGTFEARVRALEEAMLSPVAVRSYETRGGERDEEPCSVRPPFQRDRDRLIHSKPFRRLKGKTQVFIDPQGDHFRTPMTPPPRTTAHFAL